MLKIDFNDLSIINLYFFFLGIESQLRLLAYNKHL